MFQTQKTPNNPENETKYLCEFHCHSKYSKDSLTAPQKIISTCRKKGIHRIAITDHETIRGALEAKKIDSEHVIVGEEISTTKGELLAFFIQEEIPPGLSPSQAIDRLRAQNSFISVSHPFDKMRKGHWEIPDLLKILPYIDAIEVFNARSMWPHANRLAQEFAIKHNLLATVGSDAHIPAEIGSALLFLPAFADRESLIEALKQSTALTTRSGFWVHFFSRYAKILKKFK